MRVIFINRFCWPDHSATSQLLSDLAGFLSERGMHVLVLASRQRYDEPEACLAAAESRRGVEIRRIWTSRFGRSSLLGRALDYFTFYLSLPFALLPAIASGDIVVTMTDPPLASVVAAPCAWIRRAALVNWLQDLFPEVAVALGRPRLPSKVAGALSWLRDISLRSARVNVVIGERMAEYVALRVPRQQVQLIPNWPHEDAIRPKPAAESELRRRLGLGEKFVVGYSGNLGRAHDWETLLAAMRLLAGDERIRFLISGGGHGYDALRAVVESEGLGNVQFQPYHPMETLSDAMAAADLHLVSLRPGLEGLIVPSKFYGIAAAARPIGFIGDPRGELARLVEREHCGFAVLEGRGDLLADAINELSLQPGRAIAQGERARALLDAIYSRASALARWHHLLLALAGRSTAPVMENSNLDEKAR